MVGLCRGKLKLFGECDLYEGTSKSSEAQALATKNELNAILDLVSQWLVILKTHSFFFRCHFLEVKRLAERSECSKE